MGTLTQNERNGLDDVFMSIHSNRDKLQKLKDISTLIMLPKSSLEISKLFKQAKIGLNETKIASFLSYLSKKKKNLSK